VTLPLERSSANCVAFHPDGKRLAIGFYDSIEIYDTQTAIPTQTLRASQGDIERLAFRQDGSRLVSSAGRKNVADWDLQSGEVRYLNNVSPYLGGGFALSPNDKTIAVGQKDGEIVLADLDAEGPSAVTPLSDVVSPERVQFVRFSPDGQTVATFGYGEQPVTFWNALAGEALKTVPGKWEVFREVIWTANGLRIVGDMEKRSKLGVYDEDGHEVVQIPQGSGTYSEISPDRLSILVFENSAFLKEVRLDNGEAVTREEFIPPQVSRVSRGAEFTAGFENQKVTVWNCQSGKVVFSKSYKSGTLGAFSRFAAILAVRDQFGLDLVDLESPEELHRIEVPFSGELNSPIFSEYGRFVGDSSRRGLQIWDVQSRTEVISIPPSPDRKADFLTAPKFTTDETRVAIGTSDGVWVWDLESGKRLLGIQDSGPYVTDVEFSPDGTRLAVVSQRGAFIHFLGEPEIHQTP
ncbi:MAG: WD40 repeat domain-containing protein, partial [Planctomycetaceae bacterium]|nr:WD40 repeat domain-containing protein [Planctomycetaceae bacterium]